MNIRTSALALTILAALSAPVMAETPATDAMNGAAIAAPAKTIAGPLEITGAFTRATAPGAPAGGAFVTIHNTGDTADKLIGASSEIAAHVELHQMKMNGNVMEMSPVDGGLDIAPGDTLTLKPGGFHIMLIGLKNQLVQGQSVPITLEFEKAGKVSLDFAVGAIGAQTMPGMGN